MSISQCGSLHAACCQKQDEACHQCDCTSHDAQQRQGGCLLLQPTCLSILPRCLAKDVEAELAAEFDDEELEKEGQAHVFAFYDELTEEQQHELEHDFNGIEEPFFQDGFLLRWRAAIKERQNFEQWPPTIMDWTRKTLPKLELGANLTIAQDVNPQRRLLWQQWGLDMYVKRQVAICILHGAEDSSLGEGTTKGILDLGLLSHKSTLQLFFQRVKRLQSLILRRARTKQSVEIPIYLMCNDENHYLLDEYLTENNYFGLFRENVHLFVQNNAPLLDTKGRLMLVEKHQILQESSGNGYLLRALEHDGLAADLKSRCVSVLFVCSIDNVLTKIGDPMFIGYCKQTEAEVGVKCFPKSFSDEPFGMLLSSRRPWNVGEDGSYKEMKVCAAIVEQKEMVDEDLHKTHENDRRALIFDCANFSQYCFKLDWLSRTLHHYRHHSGAPHRRWHAIEKQRNRLNLYTGEVITPDRECNAWRMEQFLGDCIELSDRVAGLRSTRSEFAWLKKPRGSYSPQTVCLAMSLLHQSWIRQAGGTFSGNKTASDRDDGKCEISPLVSYDGEDLDGQFWLPIELPFYLPSHQEDSDSFAAELAHQNNGSIHFLNWESDFAKQNLNQELQFALNKVFDTTSMGPDYAGEKAEREENLPPTPDNEQENLEDLMRKRDTTLQERRRTEKIENAFHETDERSAITEWILGPRVKPTTSEALVGSARIRLSRKDFLSSKKCDSFRQDRFKAAKDSARYSARGESPRNSARGDSAREDLLASGVLQTRLSFRCVPPQTHGLEISEFGRRTGPPEHIKDWWHGRGRDEPKEAAPMEVPSGLACAIS